MRHAIQRLILCAAVTYAACSGGGDASTAVARKDTVDALAKKVAALQIELWDLEAKVSAYDEAPVSCDEYGWVRVDADAGIFLVQCENAQPYLQGYKIWLSVGNLGSATYPNVTLTAEWTADSGPNADILGDPTKIRRVVEHLNQDIQPGTWNRVELILAPATAAQLSHLRISLATPTISLRR